MKAIVIKNMPEFNFVVGQSVDVSQGQFKKFQEKYHCFDEQDHLVTVRVISNMHRLYGWRGWFPGVLQGGSLHDLRPYINSGDLEIVDVRQHNEHVKAESPQVDPDKWFGWFRSHQSYEGETVKFAVNSVSLAAQISAEQSNDAIAEWVKNGLIVIKEGKVFFAAPTHQESAP